MILLLIGIIPLIVSLDDRGTDATSYVLIDYLNLNTRSKNTVNFSYPVATEQSLQNLGAE